MASDGVRASATPGGREREPIVRRRAETSSDPSALTARSSALPITRERQAASRLGVGLMFPHRADHSPKGRLVGFPPEAEVSARRQGPPPGAARCAHSRASRELDDSDDHSIS